MPIKVYRATELLKNPILNVLVYGAPGVGKTSFGATAPKPIIINLEDGIQSISDQEIDIVDAKTIQDFGDAIKYSLANGFETIVIDSLTRYSELKIKQLVEDDPRAKTPQIQHWGQLISTTKEMIWYLQGQKINVVLICLEKEIEHEGEVVKRPSLAGKLAQSVSGIVDVVGYQYADRKGDRKLSINPNSKWYAKHRVPKDKKIDHDLDPDFMVLKDALFPKGEKQNV